VRLIVKYLRLDAARHQDLKERIETLKTALASKNGGTVMPSRPIKHVQQVVAAYFGLSMSEMLGPNRTLRIVRPRQIAMFLAKTEGLHSFPEIGKVFGRDHTTILHAVRTIQELMETDRVVVHYVDELKRLISD
jgi:chromosomal replication initiator protein